MGNVIKFTKIILNISVGLIGALAIVLLIGSFGIIPQFKTYVVQSGSMEPALKTGSVVLVARAPSYNSGDIISFKNDSGKNDVVTHRIVYDMSYSLLSQPVYLTKGDANSKIDQEKVKEEQIVGKVFFSLPFLGYFTEFVKKPYGFILFVVIPATIIVYEELKTLRRELLAFYLRIRRKNEEKSLSAREGLSKSLNKYFVIVPVLAATIAVSSLSLSFFSDNEQSQTNTFTAGVWVTPTPSPIPGIANHIVISEVQITGGPSNTTHDFIELYNPTNSSYDLSGHRLVKRSGNSSNDNTIKSWTTSTMVPAHGFYLWASSNDSSFPASIGADTSTTDTLAADNSIALRNGPENTGTLIDVLSWNDGSTLVEGDEFDPDPGANQSMERKAFSTSTAISMAIGGADEFKGNGYDTNNNVNDFILRTTSQPQNTGSATEIP